ncbi:MAG: proline--tRNA ligase [Anaerovibrio sp.]|uniref:proline--tRNA ligase n=1 Tax=Anaerovibrio sp. TaxID=1872532 RepID=UPI00260A2CCF|nr:proline--tRNA ligase [Anaerovibrio sp.]MDD7677555.1 proline--tRNA ligase [Anaerovibrio sp.]MDY2602926.1 proline--tRNA ligase [Anaerovibrio sp.]
MRTTNLYAPTLRETPAEAEVRSHQLMLRAGMIRKAAGGLYTYLPLAWRTIKKIEQIIREEMDEAGGQEISMPIVQPAEIWQESGRWSVYGDEMFRVRDRHGRQFCLGPTHEEMVTTLVRDEVRSYKQLPLMLYQIQNKYRDEIRPRFGLMRGREFIMKDLYSFDKDEEGMNLSYQKMYDAYTRIYTRMGLDFRPVEADNGAIGGGHSHEFTVLAAAGESNIAYCTACDYAASDEKAELNVIKAAEEEMKPLEKVATPDAHTIELVAEYLNLPLEKCIKAVAFQTDTDELVLAFVRGDHEVNDVKVINLIEGAIELRMADEAVIEAAGGCPGFMSPIGIKEGTRIVVDQTVMEMYNACAGANEKDMHYINVNPKRDFKDVTVADIRMVKEGDICPRCGGTIKMTRGIEAGQVFTLGTKYSKALGATFLDENGREQPMVMGCYGIGVGRTMAAAVEQNNDENGIIWPKAIAPFEVVVVPVNAKNEEQLQLAESIYADLKKAGVDALLDDRKDRAGVKFKDADLIGYPLRITVGPKAVAEDVVELKIRRSGETVTAGKADAVQKALELLAGL